MTTTESVLQELEAAGSEQTRKTNRRHGIGDNQYGVLYSFFDTFTKQIKRDKDPARDHQIGLELWATGNHDARVLAARLLDPKRLDHDTLTAWAYDIDNYGMASVVGGLAARTNDAQVLAERWIDADGEWVEKAGWDALGQLGLNGALSDADAAALLTRIERDLPGAKNYVRYAMNNVLIGIGGHGGDLSTPAIAVAQRIGKVKVDHGETGCKTPDAVPYIEKMLARAEKKKVKA